MKIQYISIILSFTLLLLWGCKKDPEDIVMKSAMELSKIHSVEYKNTVLQKRKADSPVKSTTANCYFDFTQNTPIMDSYYHINTDSTEIIYDGNNNFLINHHLNFILRDDTPDKFSLSNTVFLTYSLHSLRNLLGRLINNENANLTVLNDTTINDIKCHQIRIQLNNAWVDQLDGYPREIEGQFSVYYLMINKKTNFPVQFTLMQKKNQVYHSSVYEDIKANTEEKKEIEYKLPSVKEEYPEYSLSEYRERINNLAKLNAYETAPAFILQSLDGNRISLNEVKKPALLVFFDPGNKACLNIFREISKNFNPDNTYVLAIDISGESKENLNNYIKSNEITFPVLLDGSETAKEYGVVYTPSLFKINESGKLTFLGRNANTEKTEQSDTTDLETS